MRGFTRSVVGVVALALVLSSSSVASAQDAPAKPAFARKGFLIGFSLGGGTAACSTCETKGAGAGSFHIGGMVTDRVALMFDSGIVTFTEGQNEFVHAVGGLAAQYFVNHGLWVKGGVGFAQFTVNNSMGPRRLGGFVGVGVDLVQRGRFALDVSGRFAVGRHPGGTVRSTTAQLGFTWY